MRRVVPLFLFLLFIAKPCIAGSSYRIEVLQIGNTQAYDQAYEGILDGLARKGLVKDSNVTIQRTVLETNPDPGLWERITGIMRIRDMAAEVVGARPDLVIALGTQARAAFQDRIRDAGIPVLFSSACPSAEYSRKGIAGITVRPEAADVLGTTLLALPSAKKLGIIHTSDPEATSFMEQMTEQAKKEGITIVAREIKPSEGIAGAADELMLMGMDAFIIPTDGYYEANGSKACKDLIAQATLHRVPCISALLDTAEGSLIHLAPNFGTVGNLTAGQAWEVLAKGTPASTLPVVSHVDHGFYLDFTTSRRLGIKFRQDSDSLYSAR